MTIDREVSHELFRTLMGNTYFTALKITGNPANPNLLACMLSLKNNNSGQGCQDMFW